MESRTANSADLTHGDWASRKSGVILMGVMFACATNESAANHEHESFHAQLARFAASCFMGIWASQNRDRSQARMRVDRITDADKMGSPANTDRQPLLESENMFKENSEYRDIQKAKLGRMPTRSERIASIVQEISKAMIIGGIAALAITAIHWSLSI